MIAVVVGAALFGGGYLVGSDAADDSEQVADLEEQLETTESERAGLESDVDDLEEERSDLVDDVESLEEQLDAERNLKPGSTGDSRQAAQAAAVPSDVKAGQAANVASLTMKLTSFEQNGSGWRATIEVKNNGSDGVGPFCGDDGAEMIDAQGRRSTVPPS